MEETFPDPRRTKLVLNNLAEYGGRADSLSWITPQGAREAEIERSRKIEMFSGKVAFDFKGTKPHWGGLSPGCRVCGQGAWSCLFINGKCNCRCFYCPTSQDDISVPTTNRISFDSPRDYADYVRHFDFKGVSISGGEPLLTFDRSLRYIQAVRDQMGVDFHIWLYTNGTLATPERIEQLTAAGLKEIRFDISAREYNLEGVRMAAEIVPCVTVEIPAIPEDLQQLLDLLPALKEAGVKHLNLHQLRLTPYNFSSLAGRNYTFLHGEKVTVLESELAALTVLEVSNREGLHLPVNYCSYAYKRRYQQAATRRRNARHILKPYESVTENGFIRTLSLFGNPEDLGRLAERLDAGPEERDAWFLTGKKDRLFFNASLWPKIDFSSGQLQVSYSEAMLSPAVSYRHAFREVSLNHGRKIFMERRPVCIPQSLEDTRRAVFEKTVIAPDEETFPSLSPIDEENLKFELIRSGLQDYF